MTNVSLMCSQLIGGVGLGFLDGIDLEPHLDSPS